jgi:myo-inositol-1(or 4)-monophosphatase
METFIKNLAKGAGAILREGFGKKLRIKEKNGFWDITTQYDLAAEKFVADKLHKRFPGHGILGEETGFKGDKNQFWIVDPLDGTRNFARGIPVFCTMLAFVKHGRIEVGAVYDPIHDEYFFATKGRGAFLNNQRIRVNSVDKIESSLAAIVWGRDRPSPTLSQKLQRLILDFDIWDNSLASGGLTLAWVAAGRIDFDINTIGEIWDYAPGALIAGEAGAKVTDIFGKSYKWNSESIFAANPVLHSKIMKELSLKKR